MKNGAPRREEGTGTASQFRSIKRAAIGLVPGEIARHRGPPSNFARPPFIVAAAFFNGPSSRLARLGAAE